MHLDLENHELLNSFTKGRETYVLIREELSPNCHG